MSGSVSGSNVSSFLQATEKFLNYPGWALALMALLIIFAMMPVPVALIHTVLRNRVTKTSRDTEMGQYSIVNSSDMTELEQKNGTTVALS